MNNYQKAILAERKRLNNIQREINYFHYNNELVNDFVKNYKGYDEKGIYREFNKYKRKIFVIKFFSYSIFIIGLAIFLSFIPFLGVGSVKSNYKAVIICFCIGFILMCSTPFMYKNFYLYVSKKTFLELKLDSFELRHEYSLEDIVDLESFDLVRFLQTPPLVHYKYDFLSGVYALHFLHRQYNEEDRIPILFFSGIGFRYDASLVASKIESEWEIYLNSSNYNGFYKYLFDYLDKYNISYKALRFTFIQNIDVDLDDAVQYWYDKLDPEVFSWWG